MKVFPQAIAKGRNQNGTIAGKLKGAMAAQTPTGWRMVSASTPRATSSSIRPCMVVGIAVAVALVQVGADGHIAVMREAPRRLDIELAPAGQMVDQHDAGKRSLAFGFGNIGGDRGAAIALERDVLARHASVK